MCDGAQTANFWRFLESCISASRVQHVSDLHPEFALRPHHVFKYGRCGDPVVLLGMSILLTSSQVEGAVGLTCLSKACDWWIEI